MRRARFKIMGRLDMASTLQYGTVTIDRGSMTFGVRPLRRHREYVLPLSTVAEMVVRGIIAAEVREKRAAKKEAKRRGR